MQWTDTNHYFLFSYVAYGEEIENSGMMLSPGRKDWWVEGVLTDLVFCFSLYYFGLIGYKFN